MVFVNIINIPTCPICQKLEHECHSLDSLEYLIMYFILYRIERQWNWVLTKKIVREFESRVHEQLNYLASWLLSLCSHKAWKQSPPPPSESNKKVKSLLLKWLGGGPVLLQNQDCTWSTTTKNSESTESVTSLTLAASLWAMGNTDGTDLLGRKLKAEGEFGRSKVSILMLEEILSILCKGMTKIRKQIMIT